MTRALEQDLADPGLSRLIAAARDKFEARGGAIGTVTLPALEAHEAAAIDTLWKSSLRRRPLRGKDFRCPLRDLDASLEETFGRSLEDVLGRVGGPLRLRPQERADRGRRAAAFWADALAHPLCEREVSVQQWVERLRSTGALGGSPWAHRPGDALRASLDLGGTLPRRPAIERSALASEALGDPHALDDRSPVGNLLTKQLAARDGLDGAGLTAGERRALLDRFGVLCDPASATVLTLGLRPVGNSALEQTLRLLAGGHVVLTLGQLSRMPLRFARGTVVRLCENPTVLLRAESKLGPATSPLVCTGGWPGSAVCALLDMLRDVGARFEHHGDFDWDGLAIARWLRARYGAKSWRYDPDAYGAAVDAARAPPPPLRAPRHAPATDDPLTAALTERGVAVSEEATLDDLIADLAEPQGNGWPAASHGAAWGSRPHRAPSATL